MKITIDTSSSCNPHNSTTTTAARFSNILRRLLCVGRLQTHPFDSVKDQFFESNLEVEEKLDNSVTTPGLVARLMGLETMPEFTSLDTTKRRLIGRSRSVNSGDYIVESERQQHRRVKSSSSFRERPSFLEKEDDEFLVLSFENEIKEHERSSKQRRRRHSGNGNKENRGVELDGSRNENNCDNKISRGKQRRKVSNRSSGVAGGSNLNSSTNKKNHRKLQASTNVKSSLKEVELECNSDNASPVSVLDLNEFTSEPESPLSGDDSRLKVSSPIRKLSTELPTSECPVSISTTYIPTTEVRELKSGNAQVTKYTKMESHTEDYSVVWGEVRKMVEEDMQTSTWIRREVFKIEDLGEVRSEFGIQILDQLLCELITEFARM
ncbi:hypothetical protein ACHQM5_020825 [Ranunculus cassubicifolius]